MLFNQNLRTGFFNQLFKIGVPELFRLLPDVLELVPLYKVAQNQVRLPSGCLFVFSCYHAR